MQRMYLVMLACALILGASMGSALVWNAWPGRHGGSPYPGGGNGPGAIGQLENFTLNASLPPGGPSGMVYLVKPPLYDRGFCERIVERYNPGWLDGSVAVEERDDSFGGQVRRSTVFSKDSETVTVDSTGAYMYHSRAATEKWYDVEKQLREANVSFMGESGLDFDGHHLVSRDEACNISIDFAKNHGGLPDGWYLSYQGRGVSTSTMCNRTMVMHYSIRLNRKIDGRPAIWSGGERANVMLTTLGDVSSFSVHWADLGLVIRTGILRTAAEALLYLDRNPQHCTAHEPTPIFFVELGYYANLRMGGTEMFPVWIFYTDEKRHDCEIVRAVGPGYGL